MLNSINKFYTNNDNGKMIFAERFVNNVSSDIDMIEFYYLLEDKVNFNEAFVMKRNEFYYNFTEVSMHGK